MKKNLSFVVVILFFMGLCLVPPVGEVDFVQNIEKKLVSIPSAGVARTVRVAVYDESNITAPAWSTNINYTYDFAATTAFLTSSGFDVTLLTTNDILNHELMTADYDVFVMIDNVPKDTIVNYVYEYWLGGGGVLSFNSAFGYLFYSGIFVPEWAGSDMYISHWVQWFVSPTGPVPVNHTIMARHSMGQDYHPGDLIPDYLVDDVMSNPAILGTSTGSEMTVFSDGYTGSSYSAWALEPTTRAGGRVIQLPGNGSIVKSGWESIIIDSVEWLAPRPKGRIVYDLSHLPRLGVDLWDTMTSYPDYMSDMRNLLEMSGYTFDKLYGKASGNLTTARLSGYDMLIILSPDFNYTAPEITVVQNWVNAGGGLVVLGESPRFTFAEPTQQINFLMSELNMQIADTDSDSSTGLFALIPLSEGCVSAPYSANGFVNYSGDAFQITYEDSNTIIAGTHYGAGRAILAADMNFACNLEIASVVNTNFVSNVANWLTASVAKVLYYTSYGLDIGQSPAALALKDLGVSHYETHDGDYFNLSLYTYDWDLVIVDLPSASFSFFTESTEYYLDTGGLLIMSYYDADSHPNDLLWSRIGFEIAADLIPFTQPPTYIWQTGHSIFNIPNDYGVGNFTPSGVWWDEGDYLTVFSNATALVGFSETPEAGNASTVLGLNGRVLYNAFLIDEFIGDIDDSTYEDSFELWENQIAFMLRLSINHPSDVNYEEGTIGHSIGWVPSSDRPWSYTITLDSATVDSGSWNGGSLSINIDGLVNDTYVYEITVYDNAGYSASDSVTVVVTESVITSTTNTTGGLPLDTTTLIIIAAVAGGIIILVLVILMRKKK